MFTRLVFLTFYVKGRHKIFLPYLKLPFLIKKNNQETTASYKLYNNYNSLVYYFKNLA